jgi:hypothetical protein
MRPVLAIGLLLLCGLSCKKAEENPDPGILQFISASVGPDALVQGAYNPGMLTDRPLVVRFSQALNTESVAGNFKLTGTGDQELELVFSYLDAGKTISAAPDRDLILNSTYTLTLGDGLMGSKGESFPGMTFGFSTMKPPLSVLELRLEGIVVNPAGRIQNTALQPQFELVFSAPVEAALLLQHCSVMLGGTDYALDVISVTDSVLLVSPVDELPDLRKFRFQVASTLGEDMDREFSGYQFDFYTELDSTYKFPEITDEELLTLVQRQTFKYFWDYGHPVSGLARERNGGSDLVTSGGSGFGLMAMVVAIERGFISREEGLQRFETIFDFLASADRFHGAWSHWLNGTTGEVLPFSTYDNGGDLVETSYMAMGLLTVRQYLDAGVPAENILIDKINALWEGIEWDWYTRGGENALYWHWSPDYEWQMNMKIQGYNEALITYVMAAASPGHGIDAAPYHETWARNGDIVQNRSYFGYDLPVSNQAYGGPLFFAHYSFLGIDPRSLSDTYADYWEQNVNHSLINYSWCVQNALNYVGYSADCWGLTASDGPSGYSAHSPANDRGVITPTAALSSFPYTPGESMAALKHFYYMLGDRLWDEYGFHDAFSPTYDWVAGSYLAIDQGPIIVMIENYRSQLLWDLFMSAPEVRQSLTKLGFTYP